MLILPGDHIYKMDYNPLLRFHRERDADVTVATISVPSFEAHRFGMVGTDQTGRVIEYAEKPKRTHNTTASMGIYVFKADVLREWLNGPGTKDTNLGRDSLPGLVRTAKVFAYPFQGYWEDAGTIQAYYEANMALLRRDAGAGPLRPELGDPHPERGTCGRVPGRNGARVEGNLLCDGCRIEGTVIRSIISPGVYVAPGAEVRDSIILTDAEIRPGAVVDRAILDKRVIVEEDAVVGDGDDLTPNRAYPSRLNTGLTVIGKGAVVPRGLKLGRNVVVFPGADSKRLRRERRAERRQRGRVTHFHASRGYRCPALRSADRRSAGAPVQSVPRSRGAGHTYHIVRSNSAHRRRCWIAEPPRSSSGPTCLRNSDATVFAKKDEDAEAEVREVGDVDILPADKLLSDA